MGSLGFSSRKIIILALTISFISAMFPWPGEILWSRVMEEECSARRDLETNILSHEFLKEIQKASQDLSHLPVIAIATVVALSSMQRMAPLTFLSAHH
jgi:hypothetical protein